MKEVRFSNLDDIWKEFSLSNIDVYVQHGEEDPILHYENVILVWLEQTTTHYFSDITKIEIILLKHPFSVTKLTQSNLHREGRKIFFSQKNHPHLVLFPSLDEEKRSLLSDFMETIGLVDPATQLRKGSS